MATLESPVSHYRGGWKLVIGDTSEVLRDDVIIQTAPANLGISNQQEKTPAARSLVPQTTLHVWRQALGPQPGVSLQAWGQQVSSA